MNAFYQGGWVDFPDRTKDQSERHDEIVAAMPPFAVGPYRDDGPKKVILTDVWRRPEVKEAIGFSFKRFWQLTGACVGVGAGDVAATTNWIDVLLNGMLEKIVLPFWPLTYGKGRELAGMRGPGEGSTGSAQAQAALKWGYLDARMEGLPSFTPHGDDDEGVCYTADIERQWSDGSSIQQNWLELAGQRVFKTVSPIRNSDEGRAAIRNHYALTLAYGSYIGHPRVQGSGENAVLLGTFDSRGGHQTSIQGCWDHPDLGLLFHNQNQWPKSAYPADPAGGMPCSCWMTAKDFDLACQRGEVYVYSGYVGYPVRSGWSLSRE